MYKFKIMKNIESKSKKIFNKSKKQTKICLVLI